MNVGTKELKNRLSHYLRLVRDGERVMVTDHGEVVAELRAAEAPAKGDAAALEALEALGIVTLGRGKLRDLTPIRAKGRRTLSARIVEDRG